MTRVFGAILLLVLVCGVARAQTVIELKRGTRVEAGRAITLGDIAEIKRDSNTDTLAETVLIADASLEPIDASGRIFLAPDRVRELLSDSVDWSGTILRGGVCSVVLIDTERLAQRRNTPQRTSVEDTDHGRTLRAVVAWRIAEHLRADPNDLRLTFDPRDTRALATPTTGRIVDVRVTGSSDRLPVRYTVYEGDRVVATGSTSVETLVRRNVAIADAPIARRTRIEQSALRFEQAWLAPSVIPAPPGAVAGAEARRRIDRAEVVRRSDIEAPNAVRRGDRVVVECVSSGIIVKTEAWALENGRDNEIIKLKSIDDPRGERPFNARINGPGRAVAIVEGHGS